MNLLIGNLLGAILGDLGAILGHLEAIVNDLGAIVGDLGLQLCVHLGSEDVKILIFPLFLKCFCCVGLQVIDRRFSVTLLHPGGMLSPTWRIWEPTWAYFGAILSYVGATLGDVGAIVGHLEDILGAQKLPFRVRRRFSLIYNGFLWILSRNFNGFLRNFNDFQWISVDFRLIFGGFHGFSMISNGFQLIF